MGGAHTEGLQILTVRSVSCTAVVVLVARHLTGCLRVRCWASVSSSLHDLELCLMVELGGGCTRLSVAAAVVVIVAVGVDHFH